MTPLISYSVELPVNGTQTEASDDFDFLEDALAYADTLVYDDYQDVYEEGICIYKMTDGVSVKIFSLYDTAGTREYNSPASVAARLARAKRIRQHNEDLRDAQLHRRPLTPGKPAWEGRYEKLADGSMRLLPQFR